MATQESMQNGCAPWKPDDTIAELDEWYVRYSRGFLQGDLTRWFAGFDIQWLTLAHSLGIELNLVNVAQQVDKVAFSEPAYGCTVGDELVGIFVEQEGMDILLESIVPGAKPLARGIVQEYLVRRFIMSLYLSWSGPELPQIQFSGKIDPQACDFKGFVKLTAQVNSANLSVWVGLGSGLAGVLDDLWRRQIKSTLPDTDTPDFVRMEVAHMVIPKDQISDYTSHGALVDLETPISDNVVLRGENFALLGRLCKCGSEFVVQIIPGAPEEEDVPQGTVRLSVDLGVISVDKASVNELCQIGAVWKTGIPVGDDAKICIVNKVVGQAKLCSYEGRFAISVL